MVMKSIEQKILDIYGSSCATEEIHLKTIKTEIANIAYHEAGHAVVGSFFGLVAWGCAPTLSIIPDEETSGRNKIRLKFDLPFLRGLWKDSVYRSYVKMSVMHFSAGQVAELIFNANWALDNLDRGKHDDMQSWELAQTIASKVWPPDRIIENCCHWTFELLGDPTLWGYVDQTARVLVKEGEISNPEILTQHFDPIYDRWSDYPLWRKRFRRAPINKFVAFFDGLLDYLGNMRRISDSGPEVGKGKALNK